MCVLFVSAIILLISEDDLYGSVRTFVSTRVTEAERITGEIARLRSRDHPGRLACRGCGDWR